MLTLEKQASQVILRNVRRARTATRRPLLSASRQTSESLVHRASQPDPGPSPGPDLALDPDSELDEALLQEMNRILEEDSSSDESTRGIEAESSLHLAMPNPTARSTCMARSTHPIETTTTSSAATATATAIAPESSTVGQGSTLLPFPISGYESSTSSGHSSTTVSSRHGQRGSMSLKRKGLFGGTIEDANAEDSADEA